MADLVLVDNDARIVELVAWFLRRERHTVRTAATYAELRGLLRERRPDLLLADLELGEERGDEELPRLASEGLLPPTLVVSGYLDRDLEVALRGVPGVRGTLAKPFDLPTLERTIAECLGQPAAPPGALALPVEDEGWIEIEPDAQPAGAAPPGSPAAGAPARPDDAWMLLDPERR